MGRFSVLFFTGNDMELQKLKANRLSGYDYSASGYYFITICTAEKQKILCNVVGDGAQRTA